MRYMLITSAAAFVLLLIPTAACLWRMKRKRAEFTNIAEGTHDGNITKKTDAAIATRYLLVEIGSDADHVSVCNAIADKPLGVCTDEAGAAEELVNVALLGCSKRTLLCVSGAAIAQGAYLATTAAGKAQTAVSTQFIFGRALQAAAGADEVIEFDPLPTAVAIP